MDASGKTKKTKGKKIVSCIVAVICVLLSAVAVFLLIVSIIAKKNDSRSVEIFGYSFSVVMTDSMTGEIEAGELIAVRICDIEEAEIGSNAVYIASDGVLKGRQIVHKVIKVGTDENGTFLLTQGVKAGAPVDAPVYKEQFVGLAVGHSVFWGGVAKFFSTPANWILILTLIIGVPCIFSLVKLIVKYSKEVKQEKAAAAAKEREALKQKILEEYQKEENQNDRKK